MPRADNPGEVIRLQGRVARAGTAVERHEARRIRTMAEALAALAASATSPRGVPPLVAAILADWRKGWQSRLERQLRGIIRREDRTARELAQGTVRAIRKAGVQTITGGLYEGLTLREWTGRTADAVKGLAVRQTRRAIVSGQDGRTVRLGIRRLITARTRNQVRAVSRLAATGAINQTHRRVWRADGARRLLVVAILDGRTSPICRALSGRTWAVEDPAARFPPYHPGCRTVMAPVYGDGPSQPLNYDRWLREQPRAEQNRVLGAARAQLWRDGWSLRAMLRPDGTLKTLASRRG